MKRPFGLENHLILHGKVLRKNEMSREGHLTAITVDILVKEYNELIDGMAEVLYHLETENKKDLFKICNTAKEEHVVSFLVEDKYDKLIIRDVVSKGLIPIKNGNYFVGYIAESKIVKDNTYISICVPYSEKENNKWVYKTKFISVCFKKHITYVRKGDIKEIMLGEISEKTYAGVVYYSAPGLFIL